MFRIIKILLYLVPLSIVAVFPGLIFPFVSSKRIVFEFIVEALMIVWLLYIWGKPYLLKRLYDNKIFLAFLALIGIFFISAVFGLDFARSFWGEIDRQTGIITWLHLAGLFAVLVSLRHELSGRFWSIFLRGFFFLGIFAAISGIMEFFGLSFFRIYLFPGMHSVGGFFGLSSSLALFLVVMIFYSFLMLSQTRNRIWRYIYSAGAIIEVVVLFLTGTRASIGGFAIGFMVALFFIIFNSRIRRSVRMWAIVLLAIGLIMAAALFAVRNAPEIKNNPYINPIVSTTSKDPNLQSRWLNWKYAFDGFMANPIFGAGLENYAYQYGRFIEPKLFRFTGSNIWFDKPHNSFLEFLATTGVLGFLGYLAVWFLFIRAIFSKHKEKEKNYIDSKMGKDSGLERFNLNNIAKAALVGLVIAYFIEIAFLFDMLGTLLVLVVLWAWIGTELPERVSHKAREASSNKSQEYRRFPNGFINVFSKITIVLAIILTFVTADKNWQFARAAYWGLKAETADLAVAYPLYEKAISFHSRPIEEYVHKSFVARAINAISGGGNIEDFTKYLGHSIDIAKEAVQKYSHDPIYLLQLAQLGISQADMYQEPADQYYRDILDRAEQIAPGILDVYYLKGQIALLDHDYQRAIDILQRAIDMDPTIAMSYWRLATAYSQKGDYQNMARELDESLVYGLKLEKLDAVALAADGYFKVKRWDGRAKVLERGIAIDPQNPKMHAALAEAYLKLSDFDKARGETMTVLSLDQKYKADVEAFLKEIDKMQKAAYK